jgi:hypothetical protein
MVPDFSVETKSHGTVSWTRTNPTWTVLFVLGLFNLMVWTIHQHSGEKYSSPPPLGQQMHQHSPGPAAVSAVEAINSDRRIFASVAPDRLPSSNGDEQKQLPSTSVGPLCRMEGEWVTDYMHNMNDGSKGEQQLHFVPSSTCTNPLFELSRAKTWVFIGDSTTDRLWGAAKRRLETLGSVVDVRTGDRCDAVGYMGMKRARTWTTPTNFEGPLKYGLHHHHWCTDCFGCVPALAEGVAGTTLEFLPAEFSRDLTQQSEQYGNSQEVIAAYLTTHKKDVCVVSNGIHDQELHFLTSEMYANNVVKFLRLLEPSCRKIVWLGTSACTCDPKYPQSNEGIHNNNRAVERKILGSFCAKGEEGDLPLSNVLVLDIFNMSKAHQIHQDNVHLTPVAYSTIVSFLWNERSSEKSRIDSAYNVDWCDSPVVTDDPQERLRSEMRNPACPSPDLPFLERKTQDNHHGDVCRNEWPKWSVWGCPAGCANSNKPPYCTVGGESGPCRVD